MSSTRSFLLAALAFVLFLNWQAWQQDYAPKPAATTATSATPATTATAAPSSAEIPRPAGTPAPTAATTTTSEPTAAVEQSQRVHVRTDLLDLEIDTRGGALVQAELLAYPVDPKDKEHPVRLLDTTPATFFVAQDGLVSSNAAAPNHEAVFAADNAAYSLADGIEKLEVPLTWQDASGVKVRKVYIFTRGSYLIETRTEISNGTSTAWVGNEYRQLQRVPPIVTGGGFSFNNPERYAFAGAAWYSPQDKFKKLPFDKFIDSPLKGDFAGGWAAMLQHYFFAAWIPAAEETDSYATTVITNTGTAPHYLIRAMSPAITVAPGESRTSIAHLYIGPTLSTQLDPIDKSGIAHGLGLTADYGMLTPIDRKSVV